MFRSILKFSRLTLVHRRPGIVCNYSIRRVENVPNLFEVSQEYFRKNPRYTIYLSTDPNVYEFDTETRGLTPSNILAEATSCSWTNLPVDCTNADLISILKNVAEFCSETGVSFSSEQFDSFVDELAKRLPTFTENETICALQIFGRIPMEMRPLQTRNFAEIMIGLDQACCINAAEWNIDQVLFAGSVWCTIGTAKKTFYARFLGRHFNKYAKLMTVQQITLAMCYLNTLKRPMDDIRKFENVFEENIEAMTPLELSIICRCFMRLETRVAKPELRDKFLKYVLERDLDDLSDLLLSNILYVSFQLPSNLCRMPGYAFRVLIKCLQTLV